MAIYHPCRKLCGPPEFVVRSVLCLAWPHFLATTSLIHMPTWLEHFDCNFGICIVSSSSEHPWPCEVGRRLGESLLENVSLDCLGREKMKPRLQFLVGREASPSCCAWRTRKFLMLLFEAWLTGEDTFEAWFRNLLFSQINCETTLFWLCFGFGLGHFRGSCLSSHFDQQLSRAYFQRYENKELVAIRMQEKCVSTWRVLRTTSKESAAQKSRHTITSIRTNSTAWVYSTSKYYSRKALYCTEYMWQHHLT